MKLFLCLIVFCLFVVFVCTEDTIIQSTPCTTLDGRPRMCYPPFENYASSDKLVEATNTCGMYSRQKYCVGLSSAEMRSRCAYCDENNPAERHSANFLTDKKLDNWWQSETLADNKIIHYKESVNLTLYLGKQFHVTFIHLQFKSPRPKSMVIYRKFSDDDPWTPWQYFSSNCGLYFNMPNRAERGNFHFTKIDEVLCTEEFSSANDFYNGIVMFATIHGRPGSENFFNNQTLMNWATASQIRIELRKMFTFGDQSAEEELLLTHFYALKSLQVAGRCWCNGHGNECRQSTGRGLIPKMYCVCDPNHHTEGQSCEKCQNFYQDRPWKPAYLNNANPCKKCNCNNKADRCIFDEKLYIKSGNVSGGRCVNCRDNSKGPHCEECLEGYYQEKGNCQPCFCNSVGSVSTQCDNSGQCTCKPGIEGQKCTRCKNDHFNFGSFGCQSCNCNPAGVKALSKYQCNPRTGMCYCKNNVNGPRCNQCLDGYFSLSKDDPLGCRPCFCYAHTRDCKMAKGFLLSSITSVFNKTADGWYYTFDNGRKLLPMLDFSMKEPAITWFNSRDKWNQNYFLHAPVKFLGNQIMSYNLMLEMLLSFKTAPGYKGIDKLVTMSTDVQLIGDVLQVSVPFDVGTNEAPTIQEKMQRYQFYLNEESGGWRDQMNRYRFHSILSNLTALKIRLTNPDGYLRLHQFTMQTAIPADSVPKDKAAQMSMAYSVEQCRCPAPYTGLSCEKCAPGYHRQSPRGTPFVRCIKCQCNNQADTCNNSTGQCDCKFYTTGKHCEKCLDGYYGDPKTKKANVCKPCGCPGNTSCQLINSEIVCTNCPDNLSGPKCERCQEGYFGVPKLKIPCQPCKCHGNIGYFDTCNQTTGVCINCLYNSAGDNCETCKPGFHLIPNQVAPYRCKKCICDEFGSSDGGKGCNVLTGQCNCKPNVIGLNCDTCKAGYFNLTSKQACQKCDCFMLGSQSDVCNLRNGQCVCKSGVTGKKCDRCMPGYFKLTNSGCSPCNCHLLGSLNSQCDELSGICHCKPNVVGPKCDTCKENYYNMTASCTICPPCYGLLQQKVNKLKSDLKQLLESNWTSQLNNQSDWFNKQNELATWTNKTKSDLQALLKNITNFKNDYDKAERNISDLVNPKIKSLIEAALNNTLNEISQNEKAIAELIYEAEKKLAELLEFMKNKEHNTDLAKLAAEGQKIVIDLENQYKKYEDDINKSEQMLNGTIADFISFLINYRNFTYGYSKLDMDFEKNAPKITINAFQNFANVSRLRVSFRVTLMKLIELQTATQKDFVSMLNQSKYIHNDVQDRIDKLISDLNSLNTSLTTILEKSSQFKNITPEVDDVKALLKRLQDADQSVKNATETARNTLKKLENFDDIVRKTKLKSEESLKKFPALKARYEELSRNLSNVNFNFTDSVNATNEKVENQFQQILNLTQNIESLTEKFNELLIQSNMDNNQTENLKKDLSNSEKNHTEALNELKELNKAALSILNYDAVQWKSTKNLSEMIDKIDKKLDEIKNNSGNDSSNYLDQYDRRITDITKAVDDYMQNVVSEIDKDYDDMFKNLKTLEEENAKVDLQILRLEKINKNMLGTSMCYRTGSEAEN